VHGLQLLAVERRRGEHRRRDGQAVRREIFQQTERKRKRGDRPRRGGAQRLFNAVCFVANRVEGFRDHGTGAARS
jgi:hypothetical protein